MEKDIKRILCKRKIIIKAKIAEGGFGTIYYGITNDKEVMIKIQIPNNKECEKDIKGECLLSKSLMSGYIIKTYSIHNDKYNNTKIYSIVMEKSYYNDMKFFLDNLLKKNLLRLTNNTAQFSFIFYLNTPIITFFLSQIFEGLKILFESDYVHRDIKPENILMAFYFRIKLCDFGLTKKASNNFEVGSGTWNHQGPECYSDNNIIKDKNDSFKVDYFPIGLFLYYCYFRNHPINQNYKKTNDLEGLNNCIDKINKKIREYQFDDNDIEENEVKHFDYFNNSVVKRQKVKYIPKKIGLLTKKLLEKNISDRPNIYELLDEEEINKNKNIVKKIYNINKFSETKVLIEMQKPVLKLKKRNKKFVV